MQKSGNAIPSAATTEPISKKSVGMGCDGVITSLVDVVIGEWKWLDSVAKEQGIGSRMSAVRVIYPTKRHSLLYFGNLT